MRLALIGQAAFGEAVFGAPRDAGEQIVAVSSITGGGYTGGMKTAKQELLEVLERMPDDAPMDSLLAQMHFKASVLRGLDEAHRGEGISHEELKDRLSRWRESSGRQKLSEP